jgi:hypothetical protein
VDSKSTEEFKADMELLADCFPNIFVMVGFGSETIGCGVVNIEPNPFQQIGDVEWCGYTVVRGVFKCLRYLSRLNHRWKYVQVWISSKVIFRKVNFALF